MIKRFASLVLCLIVGSCLIASLAACSSQTYTPEAKTPLISSPTIGKEGTLRVGVDSSKTPFAALIDSRFVGLNVDIAAAIADELGLKLELVDVGIDPATALAGDTVDIVMGIDKSDSTVNFWTSDPYIQSGSALFSMSEAAPIPTGDSQKIAAQVSSTSAWEVSLQFGEGALVSAMDPEEAFANLSSGSVSYVAADAIIGTYAANKHSIAAHLTCLLQNPSGYSVGVLHENAELMQIISDTLATLEGNGMIDVIEKKWLGSVIDLTNVVVSSAITTQTPAPDPNENGENTEGGENAEGEGQGDSTESTEEAANAEGDNNTETPAGEGQENIDEAGSNAVQPQ